MMNRRRAAAPSEEICIPWGMLLVAVSMFVSGFLGFFLSSGGITGHLYSYSWIASMLVMACALYFFANSVINKRFRAIVGVATASFLSIAFGAPGVLIGSVSALGILVVMWELLMRMRPSGRE